MPNNLIFWFSGTGNSLKTTKDIAAALGDTQLAFMGGDFSLTGHYDRIGFVYPCYAMGMPKAALEFVRRLNLHAGSAEYVFSVVTCRGAAGNCHKMLSNVLKPKGVSLDYANAFRSVGNYIIEYPLQKNQAQLLRNQAEKTRLIAADILVHKHRGIVGARNPFFSAFYRIGLHYFRIKEKQFAANDSCTSCGQCVKLCPMDNIEMRGGKPAFLHNNCANCLACMHMCPQAAIVCGRVTAEKRGQYRHPDIKPGELMH
ncbi:MAG: 4Fe-4S dicluster domain-containing protein [Oscillospiraceae bacterium]|jgi:ferredoxin|nr:4Fe-4S dicluster domain-containing protein [Oscillospiraceae bacterium]